MNETVTNELKLTPPPLDRQTSQCGDCLTRQLLTAFEIIKTCPDPSPAQIIAVLDRVVCPCATSNPARAAVARAAILRGIASATNPSQTRQGN